MGSVAFYIGSLKKGGAERVFVNLATYFLEQGCNVTMVTQYKKENEYELPARTVSYTHLTLPTILRV